MNAASRDPVPGRLAAVSRGLRLRCPRCGRGRLFRGWFRMHPACAACGASFAREPGFYLGSIYVNYGVTVIVTGGLYAALVAGFGVPPARALAVCLAVAVVLPVAFFRQARSLLLAVDVAVNRRQSPDAAGTGGDADGDPLAALAADDGRAGCAMGVVLALVLAFGLAMAVVTVLWSAGDGAGQSAADAVDLR